MIAHSFQGEVFGPAQKLHGATYVVDVEFFRPDLDETGIVVDIGRAIDGLKSVLAALNYKNLDDEPAFAGQNTTTEFLAKTIFDAMAEMAAGDGLGVAPASVSEIKVTLNESHVASASYQGRIERPA